MKDHNNVFSDLSKIVSIVFYAAIFFYISLLIWPYINLPYSNPLEIHGWITQLKFNPFNNSLRFIITLVITLGGSISVWFLSDKQRKIVMRLIFISTLILSYFLTAFIRSGNVYLIDLFHDGEQIGNAALFLAGRTLFNGITFYHGAFTDPLIAVSSFMLFGKSIGSYLLLTTYLRIISFTLFFTLLFITIRSDLIFYLASIWFFNFVSVSVDIQYVNFIVSTIRDINVWLTLIFLWILIKKGFNSRFLFFLIGLLAGTEYIISFDRAYLLTFFTFLLFIFSLFISRHKFSGSEDVGFQHRFSLGLIMQNIRFNVYLLVGFIIGFFLQMPLIGLKSFQEFLKFAFWEFPRLVGLYSEHVFPSYSASPDSWLPIVALIFSGIFLFHSFILAYLKKDKNNTYLTPLNLYLLLTFIFSVIFFRIAIIRDDYYHLFYGSTVAFFVIFLVLNSIAEKISAPSIYLKVRNIVALLILLYILFSYNAPSKAFATHLNEQKRYLFRRETCYIDTEKGKYKSFLDLYLMNHLRCPPYRKPEDVKVFFSINKKPDSFWINSEVKEVIDFINDRTTQDDYVFVYNNEPGYYYYLKAKSPTRFSEVSMADNNIYRKELFDDIKRNQPKIILYSTGNWPEALENVWIRDRFPEIEEWLVKNYPKKIYINHSIVLMK